MTKHEKRKKKRREKKHKLSLVEKPSIIEPLVKKPRDVFIDKFVKQMAIIGERNRQATRKLRFKKFFCSECKQSFCYNGFGNEEFCTTCFLMEHKDRKCEAGTFFTGCTLQDAGERTCERCKK